MGPLDVEDEDAIRRRSDVLLCSLLWWRRWPRVRDEHAELPSASAAAFSFLLLPFFSAQVETFHQNVNYLSLRVVISYNLSATSSETHPAGTHPAAVGIV